MPRRIRPASVLLLFWSLTTFASAQTDTARLQGTVTDIQNAVIPGADITVTSIGTGRSVAVTTDAAGNYSVPALPPGNYQVEVKMPGFKTITQTITLQVAQIAALNFQMQPGEISTTITVSQNLPLVENASSDINQVVIGRQVTELPLNGRNFTQLATLVPGVTRGVVDGDASGGRGNVETFRYSNVGGAALSVNGLRPQANNFQLDGIDNNESLVNTIVFFPPADAIEEFRVDTSVAPAQYGRAGGSVINTSVKSGTNEWHGSAFEFLRNSVLDATPTFAPSKNPFKRNQFGGTLGGPILKDRLFVFGDYQGLRQSLPLQVDLATVPTQKMRMGDFSELLPGRQIYDPLTGEPFPGNIIPADRINKVGQNYLNAYPLPNQSGILKNYVTQRQQIQQFDDFDVRVDLNMSAKDTLFNRFSFGRDISDTTSRLPALPAGFGSGSNFTHPRGDTLGETHIFSANLINEFRFGFIRDYYGYTPPFDDVPLSANLGIPNANTSPLLGGGALIGGYNNQIEYTGDYGPFLVPENSFQYSDTVSWVRGKHNFKFGASIIRRQVNLFRPKAGKGYFFLWGDGGGSSPTHYEIADLLAGFVQNYQIGPPFGMVGTRNWEHGFYVQDDWKVFPRLTLNLGLRYNIFTWPVEVADRQANFDITTGRILLAGQKGVSRSFVPIEKTNFAPRFGFAYDLTGKARTVLRGGYGIFYFVDRGGIDNQLAQNPPFSGNAQFNYTDGYRIALSGQAPMFSNDSRLATGPLPLGTLTDLDLNNPKNVTVFAALPTNRNSHVQEWNLQIQQELGANMAASVAYVGTKGTRLMTYYDLNRQIYGAAAGDRQFPLLGSVNVQDAMGGSTYHSMQMEFDRRLSAGWLFTASYTWSHAIDNSAGAFDNIGSSVFDIHNLSSERASSNLDVRHRFVYSSIYMLPFGRGQHFGSNWSSTADHIFGGWQINGILTFQSGLPFDLNAGGNPGSRPDIIGPARIIGNPDEWFDTSAFTPAPTNPATGVTLRPGTAPRNLFTGPGTKVLDFSIFKNFKVTERVNTQFRTEFYNLTNTPQFSQPDGNFYGNFGKITSTRLSSERQIQFALQISF